MESAPIPDSVEGDEIKQFAELIFKEIPESLKWHWGGVAKYDERIAWLNQEISRLNGCPQSLERDKKLQRRTEQLELNRQWRAQLVADCNDRARVCQSYHDFFQKAGHHILSRQSDKSLSDSSDLGSRPSWSLNSE